MTAAHRAAYDAAMAAGTELRRVASFLLELHRRAHELGYRAMQHAALTSLRSLVPFDGALFGVGTVQGGAAEAHDVFLFELPAELMTSWAEIRNEDRLAFEATASPGTTIAVSAHGAYYDACPRVRAHCERFDVAHLMCTAHVYAEAGLFWVMSLYRGARSPAFTEDERVTNELLSPHLFAASRHARIGELRSFAQVGAGHGQVTAIASAAGLVLEAEPGLVDVLRAEWPGRHRAGDRAPPPGQPLREAGRVEQGRARPHARRPGVTRRPQAYCAVKVACRVNGPSASAAK